MQVEKPIDYHRRHFIIQVMMTIFWAACATALGGVVYHILKKICAC